MHVKGCSTSVVIRKIQTKPEWYILTHLSELLKLKRLTKPSVGDVKEMEELEVSHTLSANVKMEQQLWKTVWQFLKVLNIPYDLVILLLVCLQKK